jgi:predicted  nucleic acid-binding Zn-ribbon protein
MESQPLCVECPRDAVGRVGVGALGIQDDLCAEHLQARTRAYELQLVTFQITSLVRTPDRVEDRYTEVIQDLRESERATSETLTALDAANQKVARLELDCEKLARRVTEEKGKVLDRIESEQRLTDELEAERAKTESLSSELAEVQAERDEQHELAVGLEAQLTALEQLTGVARSAEGVARFRGAEAATTDAGWPAAGQPGAVVAGSEPPPTGR